VSKRVLGKGLDALFAGAESKPDSINEVSIDRIIVRKNQPRQIFDQEALEEMAASIREHGLLQPLLVRATGGGWYELVAGERRLRASKMAGLEKVPVVVRDMDETTAYEAALIENLQRQDLNPMEEATAYRLLMEVNGYTQEELARRIGKSRTYIANMVRLLNLPQPVIEMLSSGRISPGHARTILSLKDEKEQLRLAEEITRQGLSVREAEAATSEAVRPSIKKMVVRNDAMVRLERKFEELFNTKVRIVKKKSGGRIEVNFHDEEELARIMEILGLEE